LVPSTVKLLHHYNKKTINGYQEGCRLDLKPSPDPRVGISTGKYASGMDKFGSAVDRMYMKLGSVFIITSS
jgi:hypothetical protein